MTSTEATGCHISDLMKGKPEVLNKGGGGWGGRGNDNYGSLGVLEVKAVWRVGKEAASEKVIGESLLSSVSLSISVLRIENEIQ